MKGQGATDRVRGLFATAVAGPSGSGPDLITWVEIAEADSFLRAHSWIGARPLDPAERDGNLAYMARIGVERGVPDPPGPEIKLPLPLPFAPPLPPVTETVPVWPAALVTRRQVRCRVPLRRQ
jgi:hypothetical protein